MGKPADDRLWALAHAERAALAEDLARLGPGQWRRESLCGVWAVEQAVAHLTAATSLNGGQWVRSMAGTRFRPDMHNRRRLEECRGGTPDKTLDRFRAVVGSSVAPSRDTPASLGEVVVHAQDIRRPLGIPRVPRVEALTPVAEFYARRDFAVDRRTRASGRTTGRSRAGRDRWSPVRPSRWSWRWTAARPT